MSASYLSKWQMPPEKLVRRRQTIGGSDANTIMSGNQEWYDALVKEKRRAPEEPTPPQETYLPMILGLATEEAHAAWYSHQTNDPVVDSQKIYQKDHKNLKLTASVDGICRDGRAVFEMKATGGYDFKLKQKKTIRSVLEYYKWQLVHNMIVTGLEQAVISVIFDGRFHDWAYFDFDPFLAAEMLEAEEVFWSKVTNQGAG